MKWRDKVLVRILLFVARIVADEKWREDLEKLSTHICYSNSDPLEDIVHG
jgi:hypothetical protein